jgi:hypothetical protein
MQCWSTGLTSSQAKSFVDEPSSQLGLGRVLALGVGPVVLHGVHPVSGTLASALATGCMSATEMLLLAMAEPVVRMMVELGKMFTRRQCAVKHGDQRSEDNYVNNNNDITNDFCSKPCAERSASNTCNGCHA